VPHSLLLIARINDFASESFAIDEDETADEILRRVSELLERLFLEQKRRLLSGVSQSIRKGLRDRQTRQNIRQDSAETKCK
jgi:hypothetical protein